MLAAAALVMAVGGLGYSLTRDLRDLLDLSVSRSSLWFLIVAALGLLLLRGAVAFDAYRVARQRKRSEDHGTTTLRRLGTVATLAVLAVFIAAPHLIVVRLAAAQLTLLSEVFVASDTQTARPTPIPADPDETATTAQTSPTTSPATPQTPQDTTETPNSTAPTTTQPPTTAPTHTDTDETAATPTTIAAAPETPQDITNTPNITARADTTPNPADTLKTAATPTTAPPTTAPPTTQPPTTAPPDTTPNPADTSKTAATPTTAPPVPPTTQPPEPGTAPSTDTPAAAGNGADRLTIALLGSDGGYRRSGVRTDTIIVLSIDVATGDAAAFNIPRNWQYVTFPAGTAAASHWPDGYPGLANEVYSLGLHYPEAFPDVGDKAGHAIKLALAQLTGLDIQYYVMADMVGFVKVIDLFGGIDLQVSEYIDDRIAPIEAGGPFIFIDVAPGYHRFDGLTALGYVRSRAQSSDWRRMTRQRCVVGALIDQVTAVEALTNFVTLTEIISQHVTTDIPLARLGDLIAEADRLDTSRIVTVNFIPPQYPSGRAPIHQVRAAVAQALEGSRNGANAFLADACR